ncbi:hypothetical protein BXT84_06745 [Sulfobacillus thermotolerans]|uniref:3'-5' exonuclease DinG n=1 Tax=Sulfobacillus thermotolerans TaxID=338644 RepID=A0ABM6RQH5_9FIRM|nr:hypothetical protein BXT84_06745 [Sulfobacillus thermotolerans]
MRTDFVVLDLETTGLNPEGDRIIQVAMLREINGCVERLDFFVNPEQPIPSFVRRLTGFQDIDFTLYPTIDHVINEVRAFIGDRPVVGHQISFDLAFLAKVGVRVVDAIDTLEWARIALPIQSSYRLESLAPEDHGFHDARNDVEATYHLVYRIREALSQLPKETQADLRYLLGNEWEWWDVTDSGTAFHSPLDFPVAEVPLTGELPQMTHGYNAHDWLTERSPIGKSFSAFERRPSQETMLSAVDRAYEDGTILMVEAGTGTGKSLAYLTPALLASLGRGERTVIATYTLALQEQLWNKDLPVAQQHLPVRSAMVKGRGQYICLLKADELRQTTTMLNESRGRRLALARLLTFIALTDRGDFDAFNPSSHESKQLWQDVLADRHACAGSRCVYAGSCYMRLARRQAETSHIVVVNHALLAAHMATPGVLPDFDHVIIDEAHHFSDVVERAFGMDVNIVDFTQVLGEMVAHNGLFDHLKAHPDLFGLVETVRDQAMQLRDRLARVEQALLSQTPPSDYGRQSVRVTEDLYAQWAGTGIDSAIQSLRYTLAAVAQVSRDIWASAEAILGDAVKTDAGWLRFQKWAEDVYDFSIHMDQWGPPQEAVVSWWEARRLDTEPQVTLRQGPVDVSKLVNDTLWEKVKTGVLTSATLSIAGDFQYMARTLGVPKSRLRAIQLPSAFDLRHNSCLAIPTDAPDVSNPQHVHALAQFLLDVVPIIEGRTLVLTTSHRTLRALADLIRDELEAIGIITLAQGIDGPSVRLVSQFKETPRSVLIGASGLWEGVDVPGPGLSLVVMTRLPFGAPGEPLEEARMERLQAAGKSAFYAHTLPKAVLRFQQGFGRLLRTRQDRGVVVVFDPRLITSRYGTKFIQALGGPHLETQPQRALVTWIREFFKEKEGEQDREI